MTIATNKLTGWMARAAAVTLAGVVLGVLGAVPAVAAPAPGWLVQSSVTPSHISPGGEGRIFVVVENVGDVSVSGAETPVTVADKLPAGLEVTEISGESVPFGAFGGLSCSVAEVSCVWSGGSLPPYQTLELKISVKAAANAVSGVSEVLVSGGNAPGVSARRPVTVSSAAVPFGVESYAFSAEEEGGLPDTRAGSHPFQVTTTFATSEGASLVRPPALLRNLNFALPAGLIGSATVAPQCTLAQFEAVVSGINNLCPEDTAVGVASVVIYQPGGGGGMPVTKFSVPVFNLAPSPGEPARFGFVALQVPVILDFSVRTGSDYGVTVSSKNLTQVAVLQTSRVTIWGVPGDPRHDSARGWQCLTEGLLNGTGQPCLASGDPHPRPLITLPTSCTGPLQSSMAVTSWPTVADPEGLATAGLASEPTAGLEGCDRLPFAPELQVTPEAQAGNTPAGLGVDLHIPQLESPEALAEGNLKKAIVTLPEGVTLNPGAANGLGACTPGEIGLNNASPVSCPESAKVGTVEAISPSLKNPLVGSVYVAQQGNNPFGSLVALYLVVEGEGVLVKSAGEVRLDPVTGQITTILDNIPQQAVSDIKLHLFGGPRATLLTPPGCGTYTTTSQLTPYNTLTPTEPFSAFQVTTGANGSGCGPQGFSPTFTAGTVNNQAGAFSPFNVSFSRQDQEQGLGGLTVETPPGVSAILKGVERCPEPQASIGACGAGSLIGHASVLVGAGPDPVSVSGQVFLTGPYKGAPFGLSVAIPAVAGPFDLDTEGHPIVVRSAISVDPHTARITIVSDLFPTIVQGVPLQIERVNVGVDRAGFMFNPTDCEPLTVGGSLTSTQGVSAAVSSHFQAANCAALPFHPSFTASTQAATSKKNGASLDVKVGYPQGAQANIHSVAVTLPKQLPSRLTTIQQACPEAAFAANPASCPAGSNIGTVKASTPILANPLTGPAYLVSHGGAAFPDLVVVLQGEGITLDLVGSVDIKHGVTSSSFASVPDAPISSFELNLPEGPHSGLAAVVPAKAKGNLCGTSLVMPTTITGQNGALIKQSTKIAVTGCPKTKKKAKPKAKHTHRAQGKRKKKK